MKIHADAGTEKWIRWAKAKLAAVSALRARLGLPKLVRAFQPEAGTLVVVASVFAGDWIRITGGMPEFIVARNEDSIADGLQRVYTVWGLARPSPDEPYAPVKIATWRAGSFPWGAGPASRLAFVLRDRDHSASVVGSPATGAYRLVRSPLAPPQSRTTGLPFQPLSPEFDLLYRPLLRVKPGSDVLESAADLVSIGPSDDEFVTLFSSDAMPRLEAVFPVATWSFPRTLSASAEMLSVTPVSPTRAYAYMRVNTLHGTPNTNRALYLEVHDIVTAEDGTRSLQLVDTVATDEVLVDANGTTLPGELYYWDPFTSEQVWYRTGIGQTEVRTYSFGFGVAANGALGGGIAVVAPTTFNIGVSGVLPRAVPSITPPTSISLGDVVVHSDSTPQGYGYITAVYSQPLKVCEDQYWFVNTAGIKGSTSVDSEGRVTVDASPFEYRYGSVVIKNGVKVVDRLETRMYHGVVTFPSPTGDSWDSEEPIEIYVPMDAARIDGEDWVCGMLVRQQFFSQLEPNGTVNFLKSLPFSFAPAVWRADLTGARYYDQFERTHTPISNHSGQTQFGMGGSGVYFAAYRGGTFLVIEEASQGLGEAVWGVGMDAPDEAPVQIIPSGVVQRVALATNNPPL